METIFQKQGGRYEIQADYLLPCLTLENEKEYEIGVWANRHRRYLKQHHRIRYYNLLTAGKLDNYFADIEKQAEKMYEQIVNSLAEKEKITEKLKAENTILWVQKMNDIRNRATEIVNAKVIYR